MRLKRALRDEQGFMSLGSAVLGVVLILIVLVAFGGITTQVLKASTVTAENSSRATIAKSKIETLVRASTPLPSVSGNTITINASIGEGWTWTENTSDGVGTVLKIAIPKFGHTVAECKDIAATKSGDNRCVIAKKILRTDVGGMKLTKVVGWTANGAKTVLTVAVPTGWPTLRYYLPVTFTAASMTVGISSTSGKSGTTVAEPQSSRAKVNALGEIETTGAPQTLTFTVTGGTVDTTTAIFYRGAF